MKNLRILKMNLELSHMITKENFGKRISDLRIGGGKTQLVK